MLEFFGALALFLASHVIPSRPAIRQRFVTFLGERGYQLVYSLLSLLILVWLISAATRAPYVPIWELRMEQYWIPIVLMVPAFILFAGGALAPNPLSISFSRRSFNPERPGIVAVTRHPILWAFALWAFAHLVPNGDLVSVIMFGGFGLFALGGMAIIDRRKRREGSEELNALARRTSIVPFASTPAPRLPIRLSGLLGPILLGLFSYVALLHLHPLLFGPDPRAVLG